MSLNEEIFIPIAIGFSVAMYYILKTAWTEWRYRSKIWVQRRKEKLRVAEIRRQSKQLEVGDKVNRILSSAWKEAGEPARMNIRESRSCDQCYSILILRGDYRGLCSVVTILVDLRQKKNHQISIFKGSRDGRVGYTWQGLISALPNKGMHFSIEKGEGWIAQVLAPALFPVYRKS